jgi:hypothetical protein
MDNVDMRRAADRLRARALLALGKVAEAKKAFAASLENNAPPMRTFRVVGRGE